MYKAFWLIFLFVFLFSFCACSPQGFLYVAPTPRPTPPAEPAQTPHALTLPQGPAAYRTKFISAFFSALDIDDTIADAVYSSDYRNIALNSRQYLNTAVQLRSDFMHAAQTAAEEIKGITGGETELELAVDMPSWQYLGAFLYICDSAQLGRTAASKAIKHSLFADAHLSLNEQGATSIELNISMAKYQDLLGVLAAKNSEANIDGRFAYAYMHTVYDKNGDEKQYEHPPSGGNLSGGLIAPLEDMQLRDTWFAPRDNGARKHTGTDILAPANTPIYSCTSGVVLRISYGSKSGNYVIIRDEYGYDFYYMHMIRQTDFLNEGDEVQAGDVIGHVGNTGNSGANHLHLSIITPDDLYADPFPYLAVALPPNQPALYAGQ